MRMTRRTRGVLIVAGAALSIAAYVSASYILAPAVQDSGGGKASSSSYQLDASIGGPVIATGGSASSASYTLEANAVAMLAKAPSAAPPTDSGGCLPGGGAPLGILVLLALALARRAARRT